LAGTEGAGKETRNQLERVTPQKCGNFGRKRNIFTQEIDSASKKDTEHEGPALTVRLKVEKQRPGSLLIGAKWRTLEKI